MSLILKETKESDISYVLEAETDPANSSFVDHWSYVRHRNSLRESDIRHLLIFSEQEKRPVGYTILAGFSGIHKCAELKRLVITEKGKGYGQEALQLIKVLVFEDLDFHRLWLDVRDHNVLAKTIYEKNRFVVEGHLRECVQVDGRFESIYIMGLLKNEYSNT